jgi:hypothetical protein
VTSRVPCRQSELVREAVIAFNSPSPNLRLKLFVFGGRITSKILLADLEVVRGQKVCAKGGSGRSEKLLLLHPPLGFAHQRPTRYRRWFCDCAGLAQRLPRRYETAAITPTP